MSFYLWHTFILQSAKAPRIRTSPHSLPLAIILTFGVPLVGAIFVYVKEGYGQTGLWCWIMCDDDTFPQGCSWRMTLFYYELYAVVVLNVVTYIVVLAKLRDTKGRGRQDYASKVATKLRMYLLAFAVSWLVPCINRLVQSFSDSDFSLPWLDYLMAFTNPLMGFTDAIVYGHYSGAWEMWTRRPDGRTII
ncbi:hypothetical protein KIPB_009728 [Kipferlia bialata]|uniref:G-protein coupled receptors family 2 profile 2 domain-containing protein n=1 Tax=Kipferlia bialata TaxID=797122 RepID=A0A9K3D5J6_9EUKA|nr:hypothetical protein KIPB_009728 [Kipferlia bialata]|eukprot:g9728.t1